MHGQEKECKRKRMGIKKRMGTRMRMAKAHWDAVHGTKYGLPRRINPSPCLEEEAEALM